MLLLRWTKMITPICRAHAGSYHQFLFLCCPFTCHGLSARKTGSASIHSRNGSSLHYSRIPHQDEAVHAQASTLNLRSTRISPVFSPLLQLSPSIPPFFL